MPEYDNNMRGVLFKNKGKEPGDPTTEKWPDYKGNCEIEGVKYWLSAWIKKSRDGMTFMSLALQEQDERKSGKSKRGEADNQAGFDDEIPF